MKTRKVNLGRTTEGATMHIVPIHGQNPQVSIIETAVVASKFDHAFLVLDGCLISSHGCTAFSMILRISGLLMGYKTASTESLKSILSANLFSKIGLVNALPQIGGDFPTIAWPGPPGGWQDNDTYAIGYFTPFECHRYEFEGEYGAK
jgi:hypothetical protein